MSSAGGSSSGGPTSGGSNGSGGASSGGATSGGGNGSGGANSGGATSGGSSGNGGSSSSNPCSAAGLVWKTGKKTNYESYPDPGSDECIIFNDCTWAGWFAGCTEQPTEEWVEEHNIAANFSGFSSIQGTTSASSPGPRRWSSRCMTPAATAIAAVAVQRTRAAPTRSSTWRNTPTRGGACRMGISNGPILAPQQISLAIDCAAWSYPLRTCPLVFLSPSKR